MYIYQAAGYSFEMHSILGINLQAEYYFNMTCHSVLVVLLILMLGVYFREIGQKSSEELAREGSGVKAFSSFLSELSTLVPETMIPNISVLLTHLDGEVKSHMFSFASLLSLDSCPVMRPRRI